ncbi:MAG: hypothetical protein JNG84_15560 [Archangium sp.]|nr:hypothetical protein [Archangium sp.]
MNEHLTLRDDARARLRRMLSSMEQQLAPVPETPLDTAKLRETLTALTAELALGPEPELRVCHVCHSVGFRSATRCSTCWSTLPELPPEVTAASIAGPSPVS